MATKAHILDLRGVAALVSGTAWCGSKDPRQLSQGRLEEVTCAACLTAFASYHEDLGNFARRCLGKVQRDGAS